MEIKNIISRMFVNTVDTKSPIRHYNSEIKNRYPAKRFYREDLGIEFKSSMEANYGRMLNYLGVKWFYEAEIFHYPREGTVAYKGKNYSIKSINPANVFAFCPDFKIIAGKHTYYIETKGYMDFASSEKLRLFKIFYPYIPLYLVTQKEYRLIEKQYAGKIKGWE